MFFDKQSQMFLLDILKRNKITNVSFIVIYRLLIKINRCTETYKGNEGKCFSYLSLSQSLSLDEGSYFAF